jgi:hypothetical protein
VRRPLAIGLLLSVASCDRVLGLTRDTPEDAPDAFDASDASDAIDALVIDLDMDGVPDDVDPCINAPADLIGDLDMDGVTNDGDTCPYNNPNGADPDGDGLGVCDPFPMSATDRSRCLMRFSSPTLNSALWLSRGNELAWSNIPGKLIGDPPDIGLTIATTIAAASIEGQSVTTYDIGLDLNGRSRYGSFTVWLRADPTQPSTGDTGCRWVQEASGNAMFAVVQGSTLLDAKPYATPQANLVPARITARVVTAGALGVPARVTCQISVMSQVVVSEASPELAPGRFGLSVDSWLVEVSALHVLDRAP